MRMFAHADELSRFISDRLAKSVLPDQLPPFELANIFVVCADSSAALVDTKLITFRMQSFGAASVFRYLANAALLLSLASYTQAMPFDITGDLAQLVDGPDSDTRIAEAGIYPSEMSVSLAQFVHDMRECESQCRFGALIDCRKCLVLAREAEIMMSDGSKSMDGSPLRLRPHKKDVGLALQAKRINERDLNDLLRNTWVG